MQKSLGGVSDPVGETADRTAPEEDNGQDFEIDLGGNGNGGGGFIDDGEICQSVPEHGCTL